MRLFIAIQFSEKIKQALSGCINQLKAQNVSGNFTRPENLHLTLAFIGETDNVNLLKSIINSTAPEPFLLSLAGAGQFGNLWWIGVRKNQSLFDYISHLREALSVNGFPVDKQAFKPHITIARRVVADEKVHITVSNAAMCVHRISLMKSERIHNRLIYTEIYGRSIN